MKIDISKLQPLIDSRLISVQKHPIDDLYIYNYTQKAQFENKWPSELRMCRGLILDGEGNVKARPFDKFFNYEQHFGESNLEPIPTCLFAAFDKFDGSLGISYQDSTGKYCLATRGSFVSDQARVGTELLQEFVKDHILLDGYTYLFEIIFPENRIVVDYGSERKIVLLGWRNIETGHIFPFGISITDYKTPRNNAEGVVLYYQNGFMCKIKYEEYKRLHRLVTGVNAKSIWELLRNNQPFDELLERVPDEFYQWVKNTKQELTGKFLSILEHEQTSVYMAKQKQTRKEQAEIIMDSTYPGVGFAMLDNKNYKDIAWKLVKPRADRPFREDES